VSDESNENQGGNTQIRLRVIAARRARASAGFAATTFLTAISACLYRFLLLDNPYGIEGITLMGLVGLVLLALGPAATTKKLTELSILRFYKSFRFYGTVISVSAAVVFIYALIITSHVRARARVAPVAITAPAPEPHPVISTAPAPEPPPVISTAPVILAPPEFPKLVVTGVFLARDSSSAIINRRTVPLGEMIEGVRLTEVNEDGVVVELDGCFKSISRDLQSETDIPKKSK
jgi:hypothetical protein